MRGTYILLIFVFNFFIVKAQQETSISLADVLEKIETNNHTIKIATENYHVAKADYNQTNSILLPNISISHSGISTTNPLMAFGSKIKSRSFNASRF